MKTYCVPIKQGNILHAYGVQCFIHFPWKHIVPTKVCRSCKGKPLAHTLSFLKAQSASVDEVAEVTLKEGTTYEWEFVELLLHTSNMRLTTALLESSLIPTNFKNKPLISFFSED